MAKCYLGKLLYGEMLYGEMLNAEMLYAEMFYAEMLNGEMLCGEMLLNPNKIGDSESYVIINDAWSIFITWHCSMKERFDFPYLAASLVSCSGTGHTIPTT